MKLNIGGGPKKIEGYLNVDALPWHGATDYLVNLISEKIPVPNDSIEEILCEEFLEHIPFRYTDIVLKELYRVLAPGGQMRIQVPDAGKAMEYFAQKQVCRCVPHKALAGDFNPLPNCPLCGGRAIINDKRWLFTFTGAQKHPFDAHLNIFTFHSLIKFLERVGFNQLTRVNDIYKLIFIAKK